MIDNIRLYLPRKEAEKAIERLTDHWRSDTNSGKGKLGNMVVKHNLDGLTIEGSLPKYLNGENMTPLNRAGIRAAIEKLETETGVDFQAAGVRQVEVGTSIILKEKPKEYLRLFGDPPKYKEVCSKGGFLETVSYGTKTGSYQFCAYDKSREMTDNRQTIPSLFSGCNVLRLEYRIIRRRGIKAKFGKELKAYDLFDYDIYRKLQNLFLEAYRAIPKTGRAVYLDTAKPMTPARLVQLAAEQWRQSCPVEYNALLQSQTEAGALSKKNLERIRAKNRKNDKDFSMSDTNPLITELDAHITNAALQGQ